MNSVYRVHHADYSNGKFYEEAQHSLRVTPWFPASPRSSIRPSRQESHDTLMKYELRVMGYLKRRLSVEAQCTGNGKFKETSGNDVE